MHPTTNLPSLTTTLATATPETINALHLISDSIAQQRQTAARSIIHHPKTRLLLTIFLFLILTTLYKDPSSWPLLLTATTASFLTFLLSIRYITHGYLDEAERVGTLAWLGSDEHPPSTSVTNGDSDSVLVSKYGGNVIGTIVLRAVGFGQLGGHISLERCRELGITARAPVGVIRAWTVVLGTLTSFGIPLRLDNSWTASLLPDDLMLS
ncbi:uncharacterized protein BDW43DRAFT_307461 [Aspergillus alliaceus]|uniref:uncharacterized protein n=1 Tax=Petromyces alliaceus TaxID=209559 RepID=UPI0012A691CC|nr:uncharacterized protein BDW43DRAFT_307461 [Aspergillus alliaceus]KAB8237184.1 hypothetical protein BDW43DRAFT_307461 [Aspergillus alliaceus]